MPQKIKVYVLDDGTEITAAQLAEQTGLSRGLAANRLSRTSDPVKVFSKHGERTDRQYELEDGTKYTVREICAIAGIEANTARGRLNKSRDPKFVLMAKQFQGRNIKSIKVPQLMKDRMAFDGREQWALIMKNT